MRMFRVLLSFTIFIALLACRGDVRSVHQEARKIDINNYSPLENKEWFSIDHYVSLCSGESSPYLFDIAKFRMKDNKLFVLQEVESERTLFVYSANGEYLNHRAGLVEAGEKFYGVTDFQFHGDDIVVNDRPLKGFMLLDSDLNFIRRDMYRFEEGLQNFFFLENEDLVVRPILSEGVESSIYVNKKNMDIDGYVPAAEFRDLASTPGMSFPVMFFENFHRSNNRNNVLYADYMSKSIWRLNGEEVREEYELMIDDEYWITRSEMQKLKHLDLFNQVEYLNKIKKGRIFDKIYESDRLLIVSFVSRNRRFFVVYDKETLEVKSGYVSFESDRVNDLNGGPLFKSLIGFSEDGHLVFEHNAEEFVLYAESIKKWLAANDIVDSNVHNDFVKFASEVDSTCSRVLTFVSLER